MKNKKETEQSKIKFTFEIVKYFYSIAWKTHKFYFVLIVLSVIFTALAPFINIFIPKLIIDDLLAGSKDINRYILYVGIIAVGNSFFTLINKLFTESINNYGDLFERYFDQEISKRAMTLDFEDTEDPKVLDLCKRASSGMSWYSGGINGITSCIVSIISSVMVLCGVGFIVLLNTPLLLVLIVLNVIISTVLNSKINNIDMKFFKGLEKINRVFEYVYWELPSFRYGKDIRLYKAKNMVLEKSEKTNDDLTREWSSLCNEQAKYMEGEIVFSSIFQILTYFYLGFQAIRKVITLGDFTMLSTSTNTLGQNLRMIIWNVQDIYKRANYMKEYVEFMSRVNIMKMGDKALEWNENNKYTIEFRNVSFVYPRTTEKILDKVNITLERGDHLSVVGLNGAGKTTFIKLLCRMYDVTEGEILLNGTNIKEYKYDEYMKLFAAVFQDFQLFAFSIKDNIVMDSENVDDEQLMEFCNMAGLGERIKTLDNGMNTSLYKQFDDKGVEPSGGEAQKIAIARALFKNAPIVILDEPTAALDPMAEYEIYNQFDKLVGQKTAIYISHRLSSCKFCDNIAVFSEGTIKEFGTHSELLALEGGIYREMYITQAQYYNI